MEPKIWINVGVLSCFITANLPICLVSQDLKSLSPVQSEAAGLSFVRDVKSWSPGLRSNQANQSGRGSGASMAMDVALCQLRCPGTRLLARESTGAVQLFLPTFDTFPDVSLMFCWCLAVLLLVAYRMADAHWRNMMEHAATRWTSLWDRFHDTRPCFESRFFPNSSTWSESPKSCVALWHWKKGHWHQVLRYLMYDIRSCMMYDDVMPTFAWARIIKQVLIFAMQQIFDFAWLCCSKGLLCVPRLHGHNSETLNHKTNLMGASLMWN